MYTIIRKSVIGQKDERIKQLEEKVSDLEYGLRKLTPKRGQGGKFVPKKKEQIKN